MDRRAAGVLLIVAALVGLLAVPSALGRRIAGTGVAAPAGGPPTVGACLSSVGVDVVGLTSSAAAAALAEPAGTFPSVTVGRCADVVVGEVVFVDPIGSTAADLAVENPVVGGEACAERTLGYLGLPLTRTVAGIAWTPGVAAGSQQIGPDRRQLAAGQRWSACAITGATGTYTGSLRATVTKGRSPSALGLCWAGNVSMATIPISCTLPHGSQLLATGLVVGGTALGPEALLGSCRGYATAVMGGRNPELGGQLIVHVLAQGLGPQVLLCSASAANRRQLVASLLQIGSAPLPLTG